MIKVYTKDNCPGCTQLKLKLTNDRVQFAEIKIGRDITLEEFKAKFPTVRTVPFIEDTDNG